MKSLLILSCMAAVSSAMKLSPRRDDPTYRQMLPAIRHEEVHDEYLQYAFRYITAENTVVSERGRLVPTQTGGYVMEIEGMYSYIGDDGKIYFTKYRGGVDGFHVEAAYLPQPVHAAYLPIPDLPSPATRAFRNKFGQYF